MWLCCGPQLEVVSSGDISDPGKLMACADQASENSGYGESVPVGVGGGAANEKPGNALIYGF